MSEHLAQSALSRMNLREVAIAPHYDAILTDLRQLSITDTDKARAEFLERRAEMCTAYGLDASNQAKPYAFSSGVAIIPVTGTLLNRFSSSYGFVTGYNFIRMQMNQALKDDDVKLIVFDVNSYGGEAAGCFELSREIHKSRSVKPSLAVIDSNAYSAGYAIASAATRVVSIPSGGSGSIGVVAMHVDMSEALDKWGIKVTMIHAGAHKVDGNAYEKLSDSVRSNIQAGVDAARDQFVELVATNRGLEPSVVRNTEAKTYRTDEAISLGLIDKVASPSEAVNAYLTELSGSTFQMEQEPKMGNQTKSVAPGTNSEANQADNVDYAKVARESERARVEGIQTCEEAKGRNSLANHLAFKTEMSVDEAKAILAAAPAEQEAQVTNSFKAAMDASTHPNVGADASGDAAQDDPVAAILSAQAMATGEIFN